MAEVEEEVTFTVEVDGAKLTTQSNGDTLMLNNLILNQGQATSLAWLVNSKAKLEFQVKLK